MVAGNMKIITLTNVSTVKNQHLSNNVVKTSSPNSINKANGSQQTQGNNTNESPKMRYFNGTSIYNHNDSAKSLQTPKQCNANNKNVKKSQSHMFYNIPTTSVLNRKKYYQQHHRHNQHQHDFTNNYKDIRNNIAIKNHNLLESDPSNPIDVHLPCVQKQNIPKVDNSKVEDFVNNNTTLNVNNICIPHIHDDTCDGTTVDNSTALSLHRAKSEFKQQASPTENFPASIPADKHNCVGENKSINLDCNSCWTNLVTPQYTESPALLSWPWVHISRRKSSSISSTSSHSSSVSSAISASTESNPELQQNISVTYASNLNTSKKKSFRKGNTNNNNRGSIGTRYSSPCGKGQRQRRTSNVSTITDDPESKVSLITESQRNIHLAEDSTAMSTALATNTVSATVTTTSTVDSKVETTIAAENTDALVKSSSSVVTLTVTSPSSSSTKEITNIEELANLSVSPTPPVIATTNTQSSGESSSSSLTLTTPSGSPTVATPVSSPSNSYSLDFLHSVGVQMTGGANISALCKNNPNNNRTITAFNSQNTGVMSPARTAYSYPLPQRPHSMHLRYTPNNGGGVGVGSNSNHMRDQRGHRFQHHHHHHPQQLTIASFMQKDLLNENFVGGGQRCGISENGPEENDGVDVNNNNGDYTNQQSCRNNLRCHNYYQSHYQQSQPHRLSGVQQGYVALHPSFRSEVENDGGSRVIRSGSGTYSQNAKRNSMYQNNGDATSNSTPSLPIHKHGVVDESDCGDGSVISCESTKGNNEKNNLWSSKQFHQKLLNSKKSNSGSNVSYSCSSSSSTTSSVSSNSSQPSTTSYRQQKVKSSTQMNLVIETLPRKANMSAHRSNHRLQQVNYHNQQHHTQQYTSAAGSQSSAVQQPHQNIHNLTYVNTEGLTTLSHVRMGATTPSRSCSPSLPPPVASTSGIQSQDPISSVVLSYTPNHYQSQQQSFVCGKRLTTPFALNVPSTQMHSTSPHTAGNMICYAQLNDSVTSCESNQTQGTKSRDYDDSDSSSTNSAVLSQRRNKYQQVKSISLSSSSSTSSTSSSTTRNLNGPVQALSVIAMPHLQSPEPTEFGYNPTFASTSQHYTPQAQPLTSPQQQSPFRSNGVISMLNVPFANTYTDDDLNSMKQQTLKHQGIQHQQRHFYFASGEHLNATPLSAHVPNGGYWSPLQHSNFIYPQPANFLATAPCATPTATLSPGFSEHDDHHFHYLHSQQQLNIVNQTEGVPSAGQMKRSSTPQMGGAVISQQPHQQHRLPQATVSQGGMVASATNVASLRQRNGGRSSQQQTLHQHQQMAAPPPTHISHVYPQHNLLFGGPTTHIRSSSNNSHEFFTHTPPDRFLARAHLIEAKEAPSSLLNNSKWDNLSQGVWNKFINSQQTEETFKQKMRLWRYLYIIIKNTYPRFGLYLVGSTISGFGADTSDVDMCLVSRSTSNVEPRMEALFNLTVLRDYLSKSAEFENFNLIEAKVPILRFRDRIHQLEVDLNFNNCVGIKNTHLLYCYSQLDWRLRPMVLVTKLWAQYHNINNAKNMTISSYSLVLMVIHFLQYAVSPAVLPCLHDLFPDKFQLLRSNDFGYVDMNETIGPYESKNTQTIGELFLYFLEYYSCFDYTQFAISVRTGGILPINVCRLAKSSKNDIHQWKELCIEEPFDLTNTARSVYDFETFERVKAVFVASWRILQQTLDLNSIFAPIIIPSSNSISSTLRHAAFQYDDCLNNTPSEVSTRDPNTININANGSTILLGSDNSSNVSPAISLSTLPTEPNNNNNNNHITKEIFNNANGNNNSVGGSLTELVS